MRIEFKKKSDGQTILRCIRDDGTATWQKDSVGFFPFHDLTHYAVETTLGLHHAFYGILANGWDIEDFGTPWPKGKIPRAWEPEASLAESLVGRLDMERATGCLLTAEEFNRFFLDVCAEAQILVAQTITNDDLVRIRSRQQELFALLRALQPGETLSLPFPV